MPGIPVIEKSLVSCILIGFALFLDMYHSVTSRLAKEADVVLVSVE